MIECMRMCDLACWYDGPEHTVEEGVSKLLLVTRRTHGFAPTVAIGADPCVCPKHKVGFTRPPHING